MLPIMVRMTVEMVRRTVVEQTLYPEMCPESKVTDDTGCSFPQIPCLLFERVLILAIVPGDSPWEQGGAWRLSRSLVRRRSRNHCREILLDASDYYSTMIFGDHAVMEGLRES